MENADINPWLNIWIHPRKTMRSILDKDPKRVIIWLAIIAGILSGLTFTALSWYPPKGAWHHVLLLVVMAIIGAALGVLFLYFLGWLYTLTGSWLGGKGTFTEIKSAVGWSNYPFIISNILGLLRIFSIPNLWLQIVFGFLSIAIWVWGFIIFLFLISEGHRFSFWKGLLTFLIAFVLILVVLMIISLIVPLLSPLFK